MSPNPATYSPWWLRANTTKAIWNRHWPGRFPHAHPQLPPPFIDTVVLEVVCAKARTWTYVGTTRTSRLPPAPPLLVRSSFATFVHTRATATASCASVGDTSSRVSLVALLTPCFTQSQPSAADALGIYGESDAGPFAAFVSRGPFPASLPVAVLA